MHLVHYNETKTANGEKKAAGKTFHNILAVHSVRHECHLRQKREKQIQSMVRICQRECHRPQLTGLEWPCSSVVEPTLGGSTITS